MSAEETDLDRALRDDGRKPPPAPALGSIPLSYRHDRATIARAEDGRVLLGFFDSAGNPVHPIRATGDEWDAIYRAGNAALGRDPRGDRPVAPAPLLDAVASFLEQFVDQVGYGFFCGGDPRDFSPDPECSTEDEREAHRLACEAWGRGERADAHAGCRASVGFGLGTYTHSDEDAAELLGRVLVALGVRS